MRALLVHVPNLVWTSSTAHRVDQMEISLMAMGLFSIADTADRAGLPVEIVNLHTSLTASPRFDLVRYIVEREVRVVGFSVHWAKTLDSVLRFASLISQARPACRVVLGGFTASWFAREILEQHPAVDAVVRGDGEVPFREYARIVLAGGTDLSPVPNLSWRGREGLVDNPRTYTAGPSDLDPLDFARFDLLKDAHAYAPSYWTTRPEIARQKTFLVSTGRGCSFNCAFCGGAAAAQSVINNRRRFAFRGIDSVTRTIETAVAEGFTNLYFDFDPEPAGSYYLDLFSRLRARGLRGLTCCFGSWKLPTEALMDAMRETFDLGLFQLSPESWSEEARRRNKDVRIHYTNAELEACIEAIAARGLYSQVYFGYVMPYDTREAVYGTLAYVEALNARYGRSCEARNLRFSTDPGSPAFQRPGRFDLTLWAPDLQTYLSMMREANARGYLNNLQLFKVNSMSDLENYLASQMPPCFYRLQALFPRTVRALTERMGWGGLLAAIERVFLLPRWRGRLEPLVHTFDAPVSEISYNLHLVTLGVGGVALMQTFLAEKARAAEGERAGASPASGDFTNL